ncbi:acyl-CoA thioesterase [Sinimarinibacterium flocculans]|uniref:Acyl-CoA thioester hydrolase n=1 Tax=Sinimarinibacterium flocculans TaxID=985250 RepID=A0A318E718_9GAMM|nr:thioesterase family protein [Sinimarinibacterium flocculans]MEC9364674.1 thioesterase family protein [Pseudomonadota bacterium]PXV64955.1 acyl-CoA thioester hydrolase [Sinimarinibacterium flocculans]
MGDFRYFLRVRYGECDAQKVVFNARYGDYTDLAVTEYLRALGFGEGLVDGSFDYQLVRQTTEWKSPARFDDVIEVRVHGLQVGTSSFTIACEFRRAGEDALLARSETVYVMIDANGKKPVPGPVREAVLAGIAARVDHAGWLASSSR